MKKKRKRRRTNKKKSEKEKKASKKRKKKEKKKGVGQKSTWKYRRYYPPITEKGTKGASLKGLQLAHLKDRHPSPPS